MNNVNCQFFTTCKYNNYFLTTIRLDKKMTLAFKRLCFLGLRLQGLKGGIIEHHAATEVAVA